MQSKFTKGQSVTDLKRRTRYVVLTNHRDGSVSVRAMFPLDPAGADVPSYLGYQYRVDPDSLQPLAA